MLIYVRISKYLWDCFFVATGLVMGPDKQLIVLDTSYRHPFLVHLSQDGTQVEDFVYGPLRYAPPGSKFRFMGIYNKLLIVSDLGKLCRFFMPLFEEERAYCIAHVGRYAFCPSVTFTRERLDLPSSNLVHTSILGSRWTLFILGSKVTGVKSAKTLFDQ